MRLLGKRPLVHSRQFIKEGMCGMCSCRDMFLNVLFHILMTDVELI